MNNLKRGLYQLMLTESVVEQLQHLDNRLTAVHANLHEEEAPDRLALHLAKVIQIAIATLDRKDRIEIGGELVQKLVQLIVDSTSRGELLPEKLALPPRILSAISGYRPDGTVDKIAEPITSLLDTALLTNANGEPRIGNQIISEIPSAERIDLVMAFIRRSGIRPMVESLRRHCQLGKPLRILTTTYTRSTEVAALELLKSIGAEIKVSYDESTTRLHAKAWLFKRSLGFSTAFIGSSNLTHSAQVSGLEWNARFSGSRNPDVVDKVEALFETYWNSDDFIGYEHDQFIERTQSEKSDGPQIYLSPFEFRLEPFQERLLEQIALARQQGHHQNLLVSATGTGKTVMSAVDYAQLRDKLSRSRLLFIAHRKEILTQSVATFRHALRDAQFGEMWVDGDRPKEFEHVFASIQSLNSNGLKTIEPSYFDVVIIDEFHHAAAESYRRVLEHLRPVELLGLTATPERADGLSILNYFGGRVAAELRLWDAIDQQRLVPFEYFGIYDGQDLSSLPFTRGVGYDVDALTNVYTGNDHWVKQVIRELVSRVRDVNQIRALGFCVSVNHARFMAKRFNEAGIKALAIWSDTESQARQSALQQLAKKEVNVIFSVDLFNEGVDVPSVDTLLLLRPTQSATLFLQQLGRGLRKCANKSSCTVLDFVGKPHRDFRFDLKFRSFLRLTRRQLEQHIADQFPYLPAGCHMELDRVSSDIVLESIRRSVPNRWGSKVSELRKLVASSGTVSIGTFLFETGLELEDVYSGNKSWTELCRDAVLPVPVSGQHERALLSAVGRLLHVDDLERLNVYKRFVSSESLPQLEALTVNERRYLRMLMASLVDQIVPKDCSLEESLVLVWQHPQVLAELEEVFEYLKSKISHVSIPFEVIVDVPLAIRARYTRIEILAACGVGETARTRPWFEGVLWANQVNADLMAFTLDKTKGHFSPTTRYRDYAISRELIHWESQAKTRAGHPTGLRYQNHVALGSKVMLFAREHSFERCFYFIGGATYVSHESEMPMKITWKLDHPLPGDLYAAFAAAVA